MEELTTPLTNASLYPEEDISVPPQVRTLEKMVQLFAVIRASPRNSKMFFWGGMLRFCWTIMSLFYVIALITLILSKFIRKSMENSDDERQYAQLLDKSLSLLSTHVVVFFFQVLCLIISSRFMKRQGWKAGKKAMGVVEATPQWDERFKAIYRAFLVVFWVDFVVSVGGAIVLANVSLSSTSKSAAMRYPLIRVFTYISMPLSEAVTSMLRGSMYVMVAILHSIGTSLASQVKEHAELLTRDSIKVCMERHSCLFRRVRAHSSHLQSIMVVLAITFLTVVVDGGTTIYEGFSISPWYSIIYGCKILCSWLSLVALIYSGAIVSDAGKVVQDGAAERLMQEEEGVLHLHAFVKSKSLAMHIGSIELTTSGLWTAHYGIATFALSILRMLQ